MILSLALAAALSSAPASAAEVSALLHQRTQAFSDAGQQGKGGVMAKYLDDAVVFFNEGGGRAAKADLAQDGPPAPGVDRTITTTDWDCQVHGDVAVTSFVDVVEQGPAGQRQRSRFRGSETLALPEDPPAVALDAHTLDEYAGVYEAAADTRLTFAHRGGDLVASLNGGAESVQKAQARDIVFTPGRGATPKVFQRDAAGKVTGFIYLRGGNSLVFKRVG